MTFCVFMHAPIPLGVSVSQFSKGLWGTMELYPRWHPTSVVESCILDFPGSYLVRFKHKDTHFSNMDYTSYMFLLQRHLQFGIVTLSVCIFPVYAGCCCHSCNLMLGQEHSPELERLKQLSLKMQFITAPTSLSSSLFWYMWQLTHSGNSHGESNTLKFRKQINNRTVQWWKKRGRIGSV